MREKDIKPEMLVRVVGTKGGCDGKKCKHCHGFKGKILMVRDDYGEDRYEPMVDSGRTIPCKVNDGINREFPSWCMFHPDDLEPAVKDWEEILG
jgi:hypothetical protein